MKSASAAASGSRQEGERRAIPDDDSRMQIEDKLEVDNEERAEPPGAPSTSIRRKIAVKSGPRAVTTQEELRVLNKLSWATSWNYQSQVKCSGGQGQSNLSGGMDGM